MAQFRALMLWTDAWIADTCHLSRTERGTYMDLLILMWRTPGCSVPNDDNWLGKRMGMTAEQVAGELRPIISEFCQSDGNRIFQKRLRREFEHSNKIAHAQSVRAKARWGNKKPNAGGYARKLVVASNADSVPDKLLADNKTSDANRNRILSKKERKVLLTQNPKKAPRTARTPLSENWLPPNLQPDQLQEFERFCLDAQAHGRTYVNWNAAWGKWKISPYRNKGNQNGRGQLEPRRGSREDTRERTIRALDKLADYAASADGQDNGRQTGATPPSRIPKPQRS